MTIKELKEYLDKHFSDEEVIKVDSGLDYFYDEGGNIILIIATEKKEFRFILNEE